MGHRIDRREFIQKTALTGAALALGHSLNAQAASSPVLVKVSGPGVPMDVSNAIKKALEPMGGMGAFVKKGQSVLLKPNMGFPTPPQQHATTSPQIVAAVAKLALEAGAAKVLIVDNPTRRPEACMESVGVREAVKGLDVHLLMPTNESFYQSVDIPKGKSVQRVEIFKDALKVDVHIALPVAKSHNASGFSGGLKGMMGLILDRESFHSRYELNQAIADLGTALKAHLCIMDGLQVMSTDGPAGPGELITSNSILAGTDIVAVDAAGVTLAPLYGKNIKPTQIRHLLLAEQMGVGRISLSPDLVQNISL